MQRVLGKQWISIEIAVVDVANDLLDELLGDFLHHHRTVDPSSKSGDATWWSQRNLCLMEQKLPAFCIRFKRHP